METQNPQLKKNQSINKFHNSLVLYVDIVVRSLLAFVFIGIGTYAVLVGVLNMKIIYTLPAVFILSIMVSPLLGKIKVGEFVVTKYENWLNKTFKLNALPKRE